MNRLRYLAAAARFAPYLLVALLTPVAITYCDAKRDYRSPAMSPAQCQAAGGCAIGWTPLGRLSFADGTYPRDYDAYGTYVGPTARRPSCCGDGCRCSRSTK